EIAPAISNWTSCRTDSALHPTLADRLVHDRRRWWHERGNEFFGERHNWPTGSREAHRRQLHSRGRLLERVLPTRFAAVEDQEGGTRRPGPFLASGCGHCGVAIGHAINHWGRC